VKVYLTASSSAAHELEPRNTCTQQTEIVEPAPSSTTPLTSDLSLGKRDASSLSNISDTPGTKKPCIFSSRQLEAESETMYTEEPFLIVSNMYILFISIL
jgi:hypothetical protein